MHSGALMGPSLHDLPRRLGGALHGPASAFGTHATPEHGSDESEVMVHTLEQTNQEVHGLQDDYTDDGGYGDEDEDLDSDEDDGHEEEEEEEDDDDDEDGDEEDNARLCYCGHHHPLHQPPSFYSGLDGYLSDDLDMSDDAGAPLVDYLVANLLTADEMDMDSPADSDSDIDSPSSEDDHSYPESAVANNYDPLSNSIVTPAPNLPGLPPLFAMFDPGPDGQPVANPWAELIHPFPFQVTNPNPGTIGPTNHGLTDFVRNVLRRSYIMPNSIDLPEETPSDRIEYEQLQGDQCDFQGVNWEEMGVTREHARWHRKSTYNNYVNVADSDKWRLDYPDLKLPRTENFFRFRSMVFRRNVHLSHFQLRNIFAATSRSRVFYPSIGAVHQFNPMTGSSRVVMRYGEGTFSQVSALAAGHGILVAGGFSGEYILRYLDSGEPENAACHEGTITSNSQSGITNHIAIQQSRTSSNPVIAFASNDNAFRVLDATTESWISQEKFDLAVNCTALSPDRRLRVMVGDSLDVLITAAEPSNPDTGQPDILHRLAAGHRDFGFACDWADDGWTIATAAQDKTVRIWDARWLADSSGAAAEVCTLRSEMAAVRSLKFSPVGSGRRVLVAAEESDLVNVIDAKTWGAQQTVDIFGELGGVAFVHGGEELMALCCDRARGGVLQLERCSSLGEEGEEADDGDDDDIRWDDGLDAGFGSAKYRRLSGEGTADWPRSVFTEERRVRNSASRRRRKPAAHFDVEPF